jgi:hypothetical protein
MIIKLKIFVTKTFTIALNPLPWDRKGFMLVVDHPDQAHKQHLRCDFYLDEDGEPNIMCCGTLTIEDKLVIVFENSYKSEFTLTIDSMFELSSL